MNIGDIVELSESTLWPVDRSNPAAGSVYYCTGVVNAIYEGEEHDISVSWDNGSCNTYRSQDGDIIVISEEVLV